MSSFTNDPKKMNREEEALSSAKRKATVQGETLLEAVGAPKAEGEGKRPRRSAVKDTPRKTSARKAAAKPKKEETDKHLPLARGTGSPSLKGSALEEEGLEEEEMKSQGDQISETQNKEIKEAGGGVTPEATVPNLGPREYKILSPLLLRTPRHIEWRRR